jgi:hypothetical protein
MTETTVRNTGRHEIDSGHHLRRIVMPCLAGPQAEDKPNMEEQMRSICEYDPYRERKAKKL